MSTGIDLKSSNTLDNICSVCKSTHINVVDTLNFKTLSTNKHQNDSYKKVESPLDEVPSVSCVNRENLKLMGDLNPESKLIQNC